MKYRKELQLCWEHPWECMIVKQDDGSMKCSACSMKIEWVDVPDIEASEKELGAWKARTLRAEACLREMEAQRVDSMHDDYCGYCGTLPRYGHAPDCELRAILDAAKGAK